MRIEKLRVTNYRVLKDVTFKELTPFTVLCGPNGSGKSTVFDVFAFLSQAFTTGLRPAWDSRNRLEGIRSKGQSGPVSFDISYRASNVDGKERLVTYHLSVDQEGYSPVVVSEKLTWNTSPGSGRPRAIIDFKHGQGHVYDEDSEESTEEKLASPDLLAVSALGQFEAHPRVKVLREFIQGWYLSYITADGTRSTQDAGPEKMLSRTGDNLANVIQYLQEQHTDVLQQIFLKLGSRVPQLESVLPTRLDDGRLVLRLKDRPFDEPVLARFASDGTLKLLAYLVVLHGPADFSVIGIEEPENQLHPKLLPVLADEIREVSAHSQVFVTTHSPDFLLTIRPKELWTISRASDGFAQIARATTREVTAMMQAGATLGDLWSEGYLPMADPAGLRYSAGLR